MPIKNRVKTKYPGVFFVEGASRLNNKSERIYYIRYRKNGEEVEEKAGRQLEDDMTPARAAQIRASKIQGELSNKEKREILKKEKESKEATLYTFSLLWDHYKENKSDIKGMVTDENRFDNYIKTFFGAKEPKDLCPLDIDRLRIKLSKTKKPGTVKNVLELIRRLINFGIKKNLCAGPNFIIEMPQVNNIKTEDLTPDQLVALLKAIDKEKNIQAANFMKMVLYTGMRRGELFRLKWEDIDFEKGFIHIKNPKGGKDQVIPLNDPARKLLSGHLKSKSPFVFPGRKGRQRTDIKKQVNRIRDAAGLPKDFRALHGLRHVYASMLASSGKVDLYTLQRLLTHKSSAMTQRYAHLRDETLQEASNLAGSIITEISKNQPKVELIHTTGRK